MKTATQANANRTVLSIAGMTCSGYVGTVTQVLSRVPGVTSAENDLSGARACVEGSVKPQALVAAAKAAGFGAQIVER